VSIELILILFLLGTIEFEEYLSFMLTFIKKNITTEDHLKDAFNLFDQDGDGFIDTTDLREIMTNLGEKITDEDIDEMIREADIGRSYFFLL
jgi:calmodulin